MKEEVRSQKSGVRRTVLGAGGWGLGTLKSKIANFQLSILPALLAISYFLFPLSALTATHVTATYDLGANPRVMATVNGTPQYGLVFAQRNKLVTYGDVEYGPSVVKAYLNSSGQLNDGAGNLWLDLIPNLGATPGDSYYVLTLNIQGRVHAEIWVVPDVASVSGEVCRQAQPPSSTSPALFYQFLQQDGDDLPQRQKLNFSGAGVNCVDNAGQLRTDCAVSGGGGSVSKASATTSGTVKTDTTESDPVVYLKSSADSLLAAKAPLAHSHAESDVTNLVTDLAAKVASTRAVNTTAPLSGGGALSSDLTLSLPAASGSQSGYLASGDWTTFNNKVSTSRSISTTAPLQGGGNLSADRTLSIDLFGTSPGTKVVSTSLAGDPATDNCVKWLAGGKLGDAGAACGSGGGSHNLLSTTHSDTSAASVVLGDLIAGNSTPAWQRVAGNTTTTKKFLTQTGTGSVSALPAWGTIADADIPSTIVRTSRQISTTSPLGGGGTLASDLTLTCPTCEVTGNKNAASGYAGLTASTKLNVAQGQEVWGLSDLSNVSGTSGSGSTAILSTLTSLAASDLLKWSGSNWVNTSSIPESQVTNLTTDLAGKVPTSRNLNTSSPLGGGGALNSDLTLTCATCEVTGNKNAASGYAGLTSGTKLTASQGQEVWSVSDLTDYSTTSGSGSTALKATITSPSSNDVLTWNGSNWINQAPSGGSSHNLLSSTHTDTDAGSAVLGDIVSANSTPHWQRVAGNTTTTKKYLNQTGNGSVSVRPIWAAIADGDLPSTIVRTSRSISTTAPLLGGGNLSADRTFSIDLFGTVPGSKVASTSLASDPTTDNCVKWIAGGKLGDAGAACGAGGGGDNISVNGTAATDADFDDATPAAPANAINVKWQKDTSTPNNLSAYLPYAAPLTVSSGNLTADSSVVRTSQANTYTAGQKQTIPTADVSGTLRGKLTSDLQGDSSSDFTIVQIPDPECYSQDGMCTGSLVAMMTSFINWIVSNKTTENIRAVVFTGDLTHTGVAAEFTQQGSQIATLDSNSIRVAVTPGNHDYTATNTRDLTGTGKWDVTFPTTRWSGNSWWVDSYPTGHTESVGIKFDVDGKKYGILTMGMCPGSNIQTWAQGILNGETDRRWLIATHDWTLATNGERETSSSDPDSCSTYFSTGNWAYPNAAWASFAAGNDGQILGIVSGHHPDGAYAANRVDVGTYGYVVPQATADYQNDTNGGNGYIRLLKFRPSLGIVEVKTYSPYASAYKTDTWNQFTMPLASVASLASVGSTSDMVVTGALRTGATDLAIGDRFRFMGRNVSTSYCPATAFCFDYSPSSGNFYFDSPGVLVFNQYKAYATRFGDGAGSYKLVIASSGQIQSTVATGTAPMTVSSTTLVTNFNADQVDGADVVTAGSAGTAAFNAGTATTLARSDHTHREIHGFTWYFPGTPATGVQNMILPLPEGITNIALTDMRVTVGTAGSTSSTFNIQRCYVSSAACTATGNTWVDIYSSVLTLASSNYSASKGSAPDQNNTSLVAGDRFKASLVTIGTAVADVTVTLVGKWETTN